MKAAVSEMISKVDRSLCNILAAHCFAAGGTASESDISARAAESVGGADKIPADVFNGFDYVALGHLHKAQTLSKPNADTLIRYSGAPLPYSFGEARYKKTVTLYDTDTRSAEAIEVPQRYRQIGRRRRVYSTQGAVSEAFAVFGYALRSFGKYGNDRCGRF